MRTDLYLQVHNFLFKTALCSRKFDYTGWLVVFCSPWWESHRMQKIPSGLNYQKVRLLWGNWKMCGSLMMWIKKLNYSSIFSQCPMLGMWNCVKSDNSSLENKLVPNIVVIDVFLFVGAMLNFVIFRSEHQKNANLRMYHKQVFGR